MAGSCNDHIDLGEDMTSHSFTSSGQISVGAYTCDGGSDATLRIGNCGSGQGNVSFEIENGDEIAFVVAWQNDETEVYVESEYIGSISGGGSCQEEILTLPNSGDATILVELRDPTLGCPGDIQIASVCTRDGMLLLLYCFFCLFVWFFSFVFFMAILGLLYTRYSYRDTSATVFCIV